MKTLFVTVVVVVTLAGCSSWGMRSSTPSQADEGGTSSISRSPTGISSHNKAD